MRERRVTILVGHYGSGKSSLAVSLALRLRAEGKRVAIADMDIVNPYFRSADSRALLEAAGIQLVCSPYAGSNLDIPALPKELYGVTEDRSVCAVLDVGGDDRGAVALGRYAPAILAEDDYAMLFVVNFYRPLTQTPENALIVLREIEAACGLPCTALVNNSNLGAATTAEDVLATVERMERLSGLSGLPVRMTTVAEELYEVLSGKIPALYQIALRPDGAAAVRRERNGKGNV